MDDKAESLLTVTFTTKQGKASKNFYYDLKPPFAVCVCEENGPHCIEKIALLKKNICINQNQDVASFYPFRAMENGQKQFLSGVAYSSFQLAPKNMYCAL